MYVSATSSRLSRGRSTPTRRAILGSSPLVRGGPARRSVSLPGHGPGLLRGRSAGSCAAGGLRCVLAVFSYRRPRSGAGPLLSHAARASASALTLLVTRVRADDHDPAMPANDPALAADLLHARLDLHCWSLLGRPGVVAGALSIDAGYLYRYTMRP